ncbi:MULTISPECIES: TetR/AcrR family transcriptional regulator [unclassified Nocardia]|uniref:TetR/AcrR family transcriptional regulator n=1 Tax=unclassified Nocardia TaxID=2637762 RepID=UPI001CE4896B|nr:MULTISPECIES: TetR/AcrR family transcriptional regulator C-terminal domain-containing protein [unclassified Nocardia]
MPRHSAALTRATQERIAATALAIIDAEGPDALSFRAVAARLDISHATVQRRCGDIAGLLDLCVDHLVSALPEPSPGAAWAEATEIRFRGLYRLLIAHTGLAALRGARSWLGPRILERLVEPQLADSIAAGMSLAEAISTYRQLYLFTLGAANFVDHRDPKSSRRRTRATLATLDPDEFPCLTTDFDTIADALVDHEVYYEGLRRLIAAAPVR